MRFPKHVVQEVTEACNEYADYGYGEVLNKLMQRGWIYLQSTVIISPCGNFIFKRGYICSDYCELFGAQTVPPHAIPTYFVKFDRKCAYNAEKHWILQPKADTSNKDKALKILEKKKLSPAIDLYEQNVGHYRGKPVLIDW